MDTNKIKDIVLNSQLTDEAKDLIMLLLPYAEKETEVQQQILDIMLMEAKMNEIAADEAEEISDLMNQTLEEIELIENQADKSVDKIIDSVNQKLEKLKSELDSKSSVVKEAQQTNHTTLPVPTINLSEQAMPAPAPVNPSYAQPQQVQPQSESNPTFEQNVMNSQSVNPAQQENQPSLNAMPQEPSETPQQQPPVMDYSQFQPTVGNPSQNSPANW